MKCHSENSNKKSTGLKHVIHMVVCCGLPLVIIAFIPWIAKTSPSLSVVMGFIAPFICPLMMGGMVFALFKKDKNKNSCCSENKMTEIN